MTHGDAEGGTGMRPVGTQCRVRSRQSPDAPWGRWSEWREMTAHIVYNDHRETQTRVIYADLDVPPRPAEPGRAAWDEVEDTKYIRRAKR